MSKYLKGVLIGQRSLIVSVVLVIALFSAEVDGQDIIYTVRGIHDNQVFSMDSILVENIENDSRILFKDLPEQNDYQINISTGEQIGPSLVRDIPFSDQVQVVRNSPGILGIAFHSSGISRGTVKIYDMQGRVLWSRNDLSIYRGQEFSLHLPGPGFFMVEIRSSLGKKVIKASGGDQYSEFDLFTIGSQGLNIASIKSASAVNDFRSGDSIRISVYRDGYYSGPKVFIISGSEKLQFFFEQSTVEKYGTSDAYFDLESASDGDQDFDPVAGILELGQNQGPEELNVGDIVTVDMDTAGYLRKVTKVSEAGGKTIVETEQAYMDEVFVDIDFKLNTAFINPGVSLKGTSTGLEISEALTDEEGYIHPVEVILFDTRGNVYKKSAFDQNYAYLEEEGPIIDVDIDLDNTSIYRNSNGSIHFFIDEGHIKFTTDAIFEFDFDYEGELDENTKVKRGQIQSIDFYLDARADILARLALEAGYEFNNDEDKPEKVLDIFKVTAKFFVGPVPVWIAFDANLMSAKIISIDASARADWGFRIQDQLKVGGRYTKETKRSLEPINEFNHEAEVYPLELSGEISASARYELYPRVDMRLYSLFGPYAEIVPYIEGHYNGAAHLAGGESIIAFDAGLDLGLDLRAGLGLKLWRFEWESDPLVVPFPGSPVSLWRSPEDLVSQHILPTNAEPGETLSLNFQVVDLLGLPANMCPIYIHGDGSFNHEVIWTDALGNASVEWKPGSEAGNSGFQAEIYAADFSLIDSESGSVLIGESGTGDPGIDFNPNLSYGSVTDIDGNAYKTIQIGDQIWMAENLKTTRYANGDPITEVKEVSAWKTNGTGARAYCWYDNDINNKDTYGALYTWYTAMNGAASTNNNPSGVQGVCPDGWHFPSNAEWKELELAIGMSEYDINKEGLRGTTEGSQLKEAGTSNWKYFENAGGTNSSGFTAMPAGQRGYDGIFIQMEEQAVFQSSTDYKIGNSAIRAIYFDSQQLDMHGGNKKRGISVRCVKN